MEVAVGLQGADRRHGDWLGWQRKDLKAGAVKGKQVFVDEPLSRLEVFVEGDLEVSSQ